CSPISTPPHSRAPALRSTIYSLRWMSVGTVIRSTGALADESLKGVNLQLVLLRQRLWFGRYGTWAVNRDDVERATELPELAKADEVRGDWVLRGVGAQGVQAELRHRRR